MMDKQAISALLNWYKQGHRNLPWREKKDPYAIWVSEIMLQQTRVEAVKPFYDRFMKALPTPAELAACPEDQLMKLWEGLGYYNRVRNMQKCARILMERFDGKLPADYEQLLSLPGIGSYTAGAIGSIAYGLRVPAVDGNVLRVWARMEADSSDILSQRVKRQVESALTEVMPEDAGMFNQALMELGAVVCIPNGAPDCGHCPLYSWCRAGQENSWKLYPYKKPPKKRRLENRTILLIQDGHRTCLEKRPETGLLAGLYQFPNLDGHLTEREVLNHLDTLGFESLKIERLPAAKHIFSHVEWRMIGYAVRIADRDYGENLKHDGHEFLFAETETVAEKYSVPAAFGAYAELTGLKIGQKKYEDNAEAQVMAAASSEQWR